MSKNKRSRKGQRKPPPATGSQITHGVPPQNSSPERQQSRQPQSWPRQHPVATALSLAGLFVAAAVGAANIAHNWKQERIEMLANQSFLTVEVAMNEPQEGDVGGTGTLVLHNSGRLPATTGPMALQNKWGQIVVVNQLQGVVVLPGQTKTLDICLPIGWNAYWLHRYTNHDYRPVVHVFLPFSDPLDSERLATACFQLSPSGTVGCDERTAAGRPVLPDDWRDEEPCRAG